MIWDITSVELSQGIFIESMKGIPTFKKRFEIVERKGIGHPDTICDLIMNQVSIELSKLYLKETGAVQHHNMDKGLLVAGQSENKFGGGKITKPMKFILGDRATFLADSRELPIGDFAINTAKAWFENNLRFVKDEHVEYQVFAANDTSALVGYAPFTKTESIVLETEEFINSNEFKKEFSESGEDVKVMGFRNNKHLDLTIAMAFVDSYIESESNYFKRKNEMLQTINEFLSKKMQDSFETQINCLDSTGKGMDGLYLTVLGTSADSADSGEVGRGNMANRVISPSRPAGAEATAGKNPVSHIGKIYNALSFRMSDQIHKDVSGLDEVFVWMYNVIGRPVNEPKAVIIQPIISEGSKLEDSQRRQITDIVEKNLENIDDFCSDLISGKIQIA
jgi:S-adenosylmethionine synthetase